MDLAINLAYYHKKDWSRFLEIIDDRDDQHENWEDWYNDFKRIKKKLIRQGFTVYEYPVNLDELIVYCKSLGIKIDGKARSSFASKARPGE
jgi:hypothetical protein